MNTYMYTLKQYQGYSIFVPLIRVMFDATGDLRSSCVHNARSISSDKINIYESRIFIFTFLYNCYSF